MKKIVKAAVIPCIALVLSVSLSGCSLIGNIKNFISSYTYSVSNDTYNPEELVDKDYTPYTISDKDVDPYGSIYYKSLSDTQKSVYKIIDKAVGELEGGYIDLGKINYRDMALSYRAVFHDRPQYFWMPHRYTYEESKSGYRITFSDSDSEDSTYHMSKAQVKSAKKELETKIAEVQKKIGNKTSEYEAELIINDYIDNTCVYDKEHNDVEEYPLVFTSYGALVNGKAVCEGYARAFLLICNAVGIECMLVNGDYTDDSGTTGHMWNKVKIDGKWYNIDVTHNDSADNANPSHAYFNLPDSMIDLTHSTDSDISALDDKALKDGENYNVNLPEANSTDMCFYRQNKTLVTAEKPIKEQVIGIIVYQANLNNTNIQIGFLAETDFFFTDENMDSMINISDCINKANRSLKKKISAASYVGSKKSRSFTLTIEIH